MERAWFTSHRGNAAVSRRRLWTKFEGRQDLGERSTVFPVASPRVPRHPRVPPPVQLEAPWDDRGLWTGKGKAAPMVWRLIGLAGGVLAALTAPAQARPISFPGGNMAMLDLEEDSATVDLVHTLSPGFGLGLRSAWNAAEDWQYQGLMVAALLARDNQPQSQANIFATVGAGVASDDVAAIGKDDRLALFGALEADWETRRLYVQAKVSGVSIEGVDDTVAWRARTGFAPYLAAPDTWQLWLIAQADHQPEAARPLVFKGVARLFSGPVLLEASLAEGGGAGASLWFYF